MSLFTDLMALAKTKAAGIAVLDEMVEAYNSLPEAEKLAAIAEAKVYIAKNKPTVGKGFDAGVFAFQVIVKAEEEKDGDKYDDFKKFSSFHHPDGLYGPLTRAVNLGLDPDTGKPLPAGSLLTDLVKTAGVAKTKEPTNSGVTADDYLPVETDAAKAAREASEKAAKDAEAKAKLPKPVNASADDVAKYTFKRSQVQYFEEIIGGNPVAKNLSVKQLQGISDAVREYCFNKEDGTLKTKNDDGLKRDYSNPKVIEQIRAAVREKTHELGVSDSDIAKLTFSLGSTKTRSIVGSFTAAEQATVNADKVLTKNAELIKGHFDKAENKEFLEKAGLKTDNIADLANVKEDKRGVYFKTNFVPPLIKLADKEAAEITKEYAQKIADEKAKLDKFAIMDKIVEIGFPRLVEVQKRDEKGELMFTNEIKIDYAADGTEIKTPFKKPVMEPVKRPDEKALNPIEPDLNNKAVKDALIATGLVDENGKFQSLTYNVLENGKKVEKTVSADVALKDPKQYNEAIKSGLSEKFAFTEEEKKKNTYGGANLDKGIVNSKLGVQKAEETAAVAKEVIRLEAERGVKIENSPSNVMLRDAFDVNDSKRIKEGKSATSALGKYEEAIKFYNLAASYETERQLDELTGSGASPRERKGLKKDGDAIEKVLAARVASSKAEVKGLEESVKTETDETKKAALSAKLEAANTGLKALTEIPKDFDQKDKVQMINVNVGSVDLIHVDGTTDKELKSKKKAAAAEAKASEAKEAAETKAQPKAEAAVTKPVTAAVVATATPEEKSPQAAIVELTGDVNALIEKIKAKLSGLETPALAVDNKFVDNQKHAKKDWNKAVDALEKDLKELKKLNGKDVAEGTEFDAALAGTLDKARELGVVVTDKFEVDSKQTIQNLKAKSAEQGIK